MNFKKLTILSLVFLMSGVVGLITPENLFAWENPKRFRESREILKILQFQKELKKKHPWTFEKRGPGKKSEPSVIQIRGMQGSVSEKKSFHFQPITLFDLGWVGNWKFNFGHTEGYNFNECCIKRTND